MVGGKAAVEAGAVTHGAVRCSAWLGALVGAFEGIADIVVLWECDATRGESSGAECVVAAGNHVVEGNASA